MNIGRTVRVFRAEPVFGPLPDDVPDPPDSAPTEQVEVVDAPPAPVRLGG